MKKEISREDIVKQLHDWTEIYNQEMETVKAEGTTMEFNSGTAMSPHVKNANMAQQNIIRLTKLLDALEDEEQIDELDSYL